MTGTTGATAGAAAGTGAAAPPGAAPTLPALLRRTADRGGSDLHVTAGAPPHIRVHGALEPQTDLAPLTPDGTRRLVYSGLTPAQRQRVEADGELDAACAVDGARRVRVNVYTQRGAVAAAYRLIPDRVRSLDRLGLPPVAAALAARPHGLVLVTGPTGSGKTTTLAAMVDAINGARRGHILTIEDPIEYLHPHRRCLVTQREVGVDTAGFAPALRAALREDPDVVLIGELRDLETTEAALRIAETGHLTLATLHTSSAAQAVSRIVALFPGSQQARVRMQLAIVLAGVICQTLVPTADGGGRVCAVEVLVATPAVRTLIREDRMHQIDAAMQTGRQQAGMQTMTQALADLHGRRLVTLEQALAHAPSPDALQALIGHGPGGGGGAAGAYPGGRGGRRR